MLLKNCLDLLRQSVNSRGRKYKRKSWFQRTKDSQEEWTSIRPDIWETLLSNEIIANLCLINKERQAKVKCNDCVLNSLCGICDDIIHSTNPLHDRKSFVHGFNSSIGPCETVTETEEIDFSGRFLHKTLKITFITRIQGLFFLLVSLNFTND